MGYEDLKSVVIRAGLELISVLSGMVNTITNEILWCPSFSWWFPQSLLISLFLVLNSTLTYKHKLKSSLSISPCHNHELTPSTTYTKYSIIEWSPVSHRQQGSSHFSVDVLSSLHSHDDKLTNEWCFSGRCASLPHLCIHLISVSKGISNVPLFQPTCASLSLLNVGLKVHLQTRSIPASRCISEFTWLLSASACANLFDYGPNVHL